MWEGFLVVVRGIAGEGNVVGSVEGVSNGGEGHCAGDRKELLLNWFGWHIVYHISSGCPRVLKKS